MVNVALKPLVYSFLGLITEPNLFWRKRQTLGHILKVYSSVFYYHYFPMVISTFLTTAPVAITDVRDRIDRLSKSWGSSRASKVKSYQNKPHYNRNYVNGGSLSARFMPEIQRWKINEFFFHSWLILSSDSTRESMNITGCVWKIP